VVLAATCCGCITAFDFTLNESAKKGRMSASGSHAPTVSTPALIHRRKNLVFECSFSSARNMFVESPFGATPLGAAMRPSRWRRASSLNVSRRRTFAYSPQAARGRRSALEVDHSDHQRAPIAFTNTADAVIVGRRAWSL